jgi:hypothetical protein
VIEHDELENNEGVAMEDQPSLAAVQGLQELTWLD